MNLRVHSESRDATLGSSKGVAPGGTAVSVGSRPGTCVVCGVEGAGWVMMNVAAVVLAGTSLVNPSTIGSPPIRYRFWRLRCGVRLRFLVLIVRPMVRIRIPFVVKVRLRLVGWGWVSWLRRVLLRVRRRLMLVLLGRMVCR